MVFIRYYFDSLNPSAIAQQMLLQAMVKKKRHIWFFICGIGTANLIMGLAIYYGIATWVSKFLTKIVNAYPLYVYGAAAIGGIVLLGAGIRLIIKTRQSNAEKNNNGCEETENVKAPAQLSPVSLFIMGAAFCMVELTSAFPYFGFLALLTSYHLIFPLALLFMLIYNFMYMLQYGHTEQWFTCGSPLPATGLETGNGLSFLFPAYPTEGDRQAIRAEPQRSGLPYSQGCPAASRRNGGNDA